MLKRKLLRLPKAFKLPEGLKKKVIKLMKPNRTKKRDNRLVVRMALALAMAE